MPSQDCISSLLRSWGSFMCNNFYFFCRFHKVYIVISPIQNTQISQFYTVGGDSVSWIFAPSKVVNWEGQLLSTMCRMIFEIFTIHRIWEFGAWLSPLNPPLFHFPHLCNLPYRFFPSISFIYDEKSLREKNTETCYLCKYWTVLFFCLAAALCLVHFQDLCHRITTVMKYNPGFVTGSGFCLFMFPSAEDILFSKSYFLHFYW